MHLILLTIAFRASASSFDVAALFTREPPPTAANCERKLFRRADRLGQFERLYPIEGAAFRKNFHWRLVEAQGRRQLLGVPRRQKNDPPIFAVVPVTPGQNESILTVTIHPRNPNLDQALAREVSKLGRILSMVHRFPRTEFGIGYPAGSLDIVLFERVSANNTATLGQVMEFASTMAALCPLRDTRTRLRLATD